MAWNSLYPTESSMANAMGGIALDPAKEVADTMRMLNTPGAITNPQDRLAAQSYLASMQAAGVTGANVLSGSNNATTAGGANNSDADRPAGMSDADWATIKEYQNNPTGSTATPEQQAVMGGGDGTGSPLSWVKDNIGNVVIVVLGVMVVGVALIAASRDVQKQVVQAAVGAVGAS